MNKIILVLSAMMFAGLASAHHDKAPLVNIEKAHKVIIKSGMSHHDKLKAIGCLSMIKKHKNLEAAMEAKMSMIKDKCEKHKLSNEKCKMIKHKVAKKIAGCFKVYNFVKDYLHSDTATENN
jgi:hypothetical protein